MYSPDFRGQKNLECTITVVVTWLWNLYVSLLNQRFIDGHAARGH